MTVKLPVPFVLHPTDFSIIIAELTNGQIDIPVTIQIAGFHVGDTGDPVNQDPIDKLTVAFVFEDDNGSNLVVIGKYHPHFRHQEVQVSVFIQVAGGDMCRPAYLGPDIPFLIGSYRALSNPGDLVAFGIAHHNIF